MPTSAKTLKTFRIIWQLSHALSIISRRVANPVEILQIKARMADQLRMLRTNFASCRTSRHGEPVFCARALISNRALMSGKPTCGDEIRRDSSSDLQYCDTRPLAGLPSRSRRFEINTIARNQRLPGWLAQPEWKARAKSVYSDDYSSRNCPQHLSKDSNFQCEIGHRCGHVRWLGLMFPSTSMQNPIL